MARTTSLNHRITEEKKNEFNIAFNEVQSELLKDNITITKEDFLEAVIEVITNSKKQIVKVMKLDFSKK